MPKGVYPHTHIKPKQYPADLVARVQRLYDDGLTQTEIADALGLTQKVIWKLMRNHCLATRPQIKRDQRGPKNDAWKGGRTINSAGYVMVVKDGHPRATTPGGYVFEHILVAERKLGRSLAWFGSGDPRSEIVHHVNGDKRDNRAENIVVTNFQAHLAFHRDPVTGRLGGGDAECH